VTKDQVQDYLKEKASDFGKDVVLPTTLNTLEQVRGKVLDVLTSLKPS